MQELCLPRYENILFHPQREKDQTEFDYWLECYFDLIQEPNPDETSIVLPQFIDYLSNQLFLLSVLSKDNGGTISISKNLYPFEVIL